MFEFPFPAGDDATQRLFENRFGILPTLRPDCSLVSIFLRHELMKQHKKKRNFGPGCVYSRFFIAPPAQKRRNFHFTRMIMRPFLPAIPPHQIPRHRISQGCRPPPDHAGSGSVPDIRRKVAAIQKAHRKIRVQPERPVDIADGAPHVAAFRPETRAIIQRKGRFRVQCVSPDRKRRPDSRKKRSACWQACTTPRHHRRRPRGRTPANPAF